MPEQAEQRDIVDNFQTSTNHERQAAKELASINPAMAGLTDEAKLRGAAVKLAAAVRSTRIGRYLLVRSWCNGILCRHRGWVLCVRCTDRGRNVQGEGAHIATAVTASSGSKKGGFFCVL
jgi:hypothetical protein